MSPKKILAALALCLALAGAAFLWRSKLNPQNQDSPANTATTNTTTPAAPAGRPTAAPPPPGVSASFVTFLLAEAPLLEKKTDAEEAQKRMEQQAQIMSEADLNFAKDVALSDKSSAAERIIAVYLLSLAGPRAYKILLEHASAPFTAPPNPEPHSADEIKNSQEKALRAIAIDALLEQATTQEKRDDLSKLATETREPWLRSYIEKGLKALSPL